jgi:hypothetical protein
MIASTPVTAKFITLIRAMIKNTPNPVGVKHGEYDLELGQLAGHRLPQYHRHEFYE